MTQIGIASDARTLASEKIYPEREQMIAQILEKKPDHLTAKILGQYGIEGLRRIYRCRVLGFKVGMVKA